MDRYAVKEKIARGGMGVVFRGEDERLHRPVCVKLFATPDDTRPEYKTILEHFVQEAFTLSRLQHPNTLRIYDFGYVDDEKQTDPFFVTEFADAGNLSELVEETGPLAATEVLRILEPMVGALREAHDSGVVHRDIKPSNILFTYAGGGLMPKLADFSIAKAIGDVPHRAEDTNVQVPLYSLSWAAPEQLTDGEVGPAADLFALGLTTAFMFTGELVYAGNEVMKLYHLRSQGAEYLKRRIDEFPMARAVARVVHKACSEQPEDRHPSVEAFFDDLTDAVDELESPSTSTRPEISIISHSGEIPPREGAAAPGGSHWDEGLGLDAPTGAHLEVPLPSGERPVVRTGTTKRQEETYEVPRADSPPPPPRPQPAPKPRLRIIDLRSREAVIGTRRIRLHEVDDSPLLIPGIDQRTPPKLRITPVDLHGAHVHVKGLNCFVGVGDRRPSSGASVTQTSELTLYDASMNPQGRLRVIIGRVVADAHVFELGESILELSVDLAPWAALIELANARDGLLLYR
jgi:serine/threonine-protein kinase